MQDVALAAGVSRMTVSLALRNSPRLSEATRTRVQAVAVELGYVPDPVVQQLASHLSQARRKETGLAIAWINAWHTRQGWRQVEPFRAMFAGATQAAEATGFHLEEFWIKEPGITGGKLSRILVQRGIERVIIGPMSHGGGHLTLDWAHFSVIAVGYSMKAPQVHRVANHQLHSIRSAIRHLQRAGHRRIGLCIDKAHDDRVDQSWSIGLAHHHSTLPEDQRVAPLLSRKWHPPALADWARRERPDAILTHYYQLPDILREAGVLDDRAITVAMLDWPGGAPHLPGINQRHFEIGAAAVEQVIGQANRYERGLPAVPKVLMVEGVWTDGSRVVLQ